MVNKLKDVLVTLVLALTVFVVFILCPVLYLDWCYQGEMIEQADVQVIQSNTNCDGAKTCIIVNVK